MSSIILQGLTVEQLQAFIKETIECSISKSSKEKAEENSHSQINSFLTRKEAAKRLNISVVTLHKWTTEGILIAYRISSRIRYKEKEIEDALSQVEALKYKKR